VLLSTAGLLEALFERNGDGWGAMYHTTKGVKAIKKLPLTVEDTRKYIIKLPDDSRPVALHWRMKTSGKIDTENAHPHAVKGGWLIHNGVLDIDMDSAPHMCDTYHFARQYLDGAVSSVIASPKLQSLVGDFIGNNRFVLMADDGRMCIINKDQGYEAQGLWFANDYSMPRKLVDPSYAPKFFGNHGRGGCTGSSPGFKPGAYDWAAPPLLSRDYEWADDYKEESDAPSEYEGAVFDAVMDLDVDALEDMLYSDPSSVIRYITGSFGISEYSPSGDMSAQDNWVRGLWCAQDVDALLRYLDLDTTGARYTEVATTLLYHCQLDETMACA